MNDQLSRWPIRDLEISNATPLQSELPPTPWTNLCTLGDKYSPAFDVKTQEDADLHLLWLVGWALRFRGVRDESGAGRRPTWKEAFKIEREALAWFALCRDVVRLYSSHESVEGLIVKVENTKHRDFVKQWFRAELPASVIGEQKPGILERLYLRNERNARRKGVNYTRNQTPMQDRPPQEAKAGAKGTGSPVQGGLF